jgi:hypothetical protein
MSLDLLGENHFTTANNYYHYARTLAALSRYSEAETMATKAL